MQSLIPHHAKLEETLTVDGQELKRKIRSGTNIQNVLYVINKKLIT